jgi:hypothetical protein
MMKFDFMVQTRDMEIKAVARAVAVAESIALWPMIVRLANELDEPGSLILVANEAGEVVIRIGMESARRLALPEPQAAAS